ncbi:unnamed protein product [Ectocarpus sp. CCAP 1310/34]|nr:unnamed protein product [Ectocarpus sp. CCAP 1310/34]
MHEEVVWLEVANEGVVVESPANTANSTTPKPFAMSGDAPAMAMAEANEDEPDLVVMGERVGNDQEQVSEWHNTMVVLFFAETLSSHLPRGAGIASGEDSLPPWDGGDVLGSEMPGIADHLAGTFKTTPYDAFGVTEQLAASPMEDGVQTAAATLTPPLPVAVATAIGGDQVAVATAMSDQEDDEGGYAATRLDWDVPGVMRHTNVGPQLHRAGRVESNPF